MKKLYKEDIITAIATPKGVGAIAVIRVSGKGSIDLLKSIVINPEKIISPRKVYYTKIIDENNEVLDDVIVFFFKEPNSYTGEDSFEIHTHGGDFISNRILELLLKKGARLAKPGEFTQRAFLNGKIELLQAESIEKLISSSNELTYKKYLKVLNKELKEDVLYKLREKLINILYNIEAIVDFEEEENEYLNKDELLNLISEIEKNIDKNIEYIISLNNLDKGFNMLIIGKPNVGKSSIMNLLLKKEKAIVFHKEGTTRDIIEDSFYIDGIKITILDTAGIRRTEDEIEKIGIEKTLKELEYADFVLVVKDLSRDEDENDLYIDEILKDKDIKVLYVYNKLDLYKENSKINFKNPYVKISAIKEEDREKLINFIKENILKHYKDVLKEDFNLYNLRHKSILEDIKKEILELKENFNILTSDLIAYHIRNILSLFDELYGRITDEDILDKIFSNFCIGK